jgi:hypothetical protein
MSVFVSVCVSMCVFVCVCVCVCDTCRKSSSKYSSIKLHEDSLGVSRVTTAWQVDRQADRQAVIPSETDAFFAIFRY